MKIRALISTLLLAAFATGVCAQQAKVQDPAQSKELNVAAYEKLLRSDIKAQKEEIVKEDMQLTDKQLAAFWPVYKNYSDEQAKIYDEKLAIVNDYAEHFLEMTDDQAEQLAQRVMAVDDRRAELRKKYFSLMKQVLPTVLVVRFFQIDNQLQMLADLQISASLPIVEEAGQ